MSGDDCTVTALTEAEMELWDEAAKRHHIAPSPTFPEGVSWQVAYERSWHDVKDQIIARREAQRRSPGFRPAQLTSWVPTPGHYYVQDTRTIVGNCALFECADRRGYTCNLDKAGVFTEAEAKAIVRGGDRRMFPCEQVSPLADVHVDAGRLLRLLRESGS